MAEPVGDIRPENRRPIERAAPFSEQRVMRKSGLIQPLISVATDANGASSRILLVGTRAHHGKPNAKTAQSHPRMGPAPDSDSSTASRAKLRTT